MSRDNKGRFGKGNAGKPKGAKSKILSNIRIATYFKEKGFDSLLADISKLEDKDRVNAQLKLLEFVMPKQKAVDMTTTVETTEEQKTITELKKELEDLQKLKKEASWNPNDE